MEAMGEDSQAVFTVLRVGFGVMRGPPVGGPLPLVNTVHIDSSGKDVGGASQRQCR